MGVPSFWNRLSPLVVPVLGAGVIGLGIWKNHPRDASASEGATQPDARAIAAYAPSTRFPLAMRTQRYLLLSDADPSWVREQGDWLEEVATIFGREASALGFSLAPTPSPMRVMLFAQRDDFIRFAREVDSVDARWMGGYYEPARNRVVAYDDRSSDSFRRVAHSARAQDDAARATRAKLAHEAAHLLAFNTGVQVRGVDYPVWFTEGLAERVARAAMGDDHEHDDACPVGARLPAHARAPWRTTADAISSLAFAVARVSSTDDHHARYALWAAAFDALADSRPGAIAELAESIRRADTGATRFVTAPLD